MNKLIIMLCIISLLTLFLVGCKDSNQAGVNTTDEEKATFVTGNEPNCVAASKKLQLQLPSTMMTGGLGH